MMCLTHRSLWVLDDLSHAVFFYNVFNIATNAFSIPMSIIFITVVFFAALSYRSFIYYVHGIRSIFMN